MRMEGNGGERQLMYGQAAEFRHRAPQVTALSMTPRLLARFCAGSTQRLRPGRCTITCSWADQLVAVDRLAAYET